MTLQTAAISDTTCQEYFMPGGRCFSDVLQRLPGSLEPGLRLLGRCVTVLRRMFEDDVFLPSTALAFGGCRTKVMLQN